MNRPVACKTIYDFFFEKAILLNTKTAISYNHGHISYSDLLKRIDEIAAVLSHYNVNSSCKVALYMSPSVDFIATMFACFKMGIAYIPLNKAYPRDYLNNIMQDANVDFILINEVTEFVTVGEHYHTPINISGNSNLPSSDIEIKRTFNDCAYIIYTSGTTNKPKGVVIKQDSIFNLMAATKQLYNINDQDVILLFHSLSFDFSVWEILSALLAGAELVIVPDHMKQNIEDFFAFLVENKVSILNTTPSFFYQLLILLQRQPSSMLAGLKLRLIIFGGEKLSPHQLQSWFNLGISKDALLYNMYGITEGTIHSTFKKILPEDTQLPESNIGSALAGIELAIVSDEGIIVQNSGVGELYLTGVSIAQGYLNHSELNNEGFILKNLDGLGTKRWFKTGDLVQRNQDGELLYVGRKKDFIKINGFRVNYLEIENALRSEKNISNIWVTSYAPVIDSPRLVVFLEGNTNMVDETTVKKTLNEKLPSYMHPHKIFILEKFPLTLNGKLNQDELLHYIGHADTRASSRLLKSPSIVDRIHYAWCMTLQCTHVEEDVNFFDAGGDSLTLLKLHAFMLDSLELDISLKNLIRFSTINQQIEYFTEMSPALYHAK